MGKSHGGKRDGSGRKKAIDKPRPKGQPTLPFAPPPKPHRPPVTVEESRNRKLAEQEKAARQTESRQQNEARKKLIAVEQAEAKQRDEERAMFNWERLADEAEKRISGGYDDDDDDFDDDDDDDDDEDYEDSDQDDDSEEEQNDIFGGGLKPRRRRVKYKPPRGSALAAYLESLKERIIGPSGSTDLENGRQWYFYQ